MNARQRRTTLRLMARIHRHFFPVHADYEHRPYPLHVAKPERCVVVKYSGRYIGCRSSTGDFFWARPDQLHRLY